MRLDEIDDWEYYDDLMYGKQTPNIPSRAGYVRNASLLHWLQDWLGVNRRYEKKRQLKMLPSVTIPARYKRLPPNAQTCYRGIKLTTDQVDRLLNKGQLTLRADGIVSYSLNYGAASNFAIIEPCVIVEKPIYRTEIMLYVPSTLDDMTWCGDTKPGEYDEQRRELNFFAREEEILFYDDHPYYRTIYLEECVLLAHEGLRHNFKRKFERDK
jgi:hypothetical protein